MADTIGKYEKEKVKEGENVREVKKSLQKVFTVTALHYRRWTQTPKAAIVFLLAFILSYLLTEQILDIVQIQNLSVQLAEPFIWTFGDAKSILLASLPLVILFSDLPLASNEVPFYLVRCSRGKWLAGELLYVASASFLYLLWIFCSTMVLCTRHAYVENRWSNAAVLFAYMNGDSAIPASMKAMQQTTPYNCLIIVSLLVLGYLMLAVSIQFAVTLRHTQTAGVAAFLIFTAYGFILQPSTIVKLFDLQKEQLYRANVLVGWISPLNQATYSMHNFGYDLLPTLLQSGGIFLIGIVVCCVQSSHAMDRYAFSFSGTENEI